MRIKKLPLILCISIMLSNISFAVYAEEITAAPVETVNEAVPNEIAVMHNTVKRVIENGLSANEQMHWLLDDIAGYFKLFPDKEDMLSDEERQKCIDRIVAETDETETASVLAKSIIALSAIGANPQNTCDSTGKSIDIVAKLSALIDAGSLSVANVYTLPYVIIAMRDYAAPEKMNILIKAAIRQKNDWQNDNWGIDAITPMMRALCPYAEDNDDVKTALSESVELVKNAQGDSGAILCPGLMGEGLSDSAASTGLAIAGLAAMGINPKTVTKNGKSLIDGLMSLAEDGLDGFLSSSFDTEQGLRGLVYWQLAKPFDDEIIEEENTDEGAPAGSTEIEETGSGSGNSQNTEEEEKISVTVRIMAHSKNECNNEYTYKSNSAKYAEILSKTVEMNEKETVYDATVKILEAGGISYTDRSGYIAEIGGFSEFDHGKNSGWMYMVNGAHQNKGCKDTRLLPDSVILWYYTDDYTREKGSESYKSNTDIKADIKAEPEKTEVPEEIVPSEPEKRTYKVDTFSDVKESDWHYTAVKYVYENNLMSGTDKGFEPNLKMTRAMLVSVLFRLSGETKEKAGIMFGDVKEGEWYTDAVVWAASVGIVSGVGGNNFAPDSEITREQMAVILYNFAKYKNHTLSDEKSEKSAEFEDFSEVSDYAKSAVLWANAEGIMSGESETELKPKNSATRAQVASLLMRYTQKETEKK